MKNLNISLQRVLLWSCALLALLALSACGSELSPTIGNQPQSTVTVNPGFQTTMTPIPTSAPYRCGAWTSNNRPGTNATILVYARLTHELKGVQGKGATAVVHFSSGDASLTDATSDAGGYVTFTLQLQGRQAHNKPAIIDVTFNDVSGKNVTCQAFFTPN